MTDMIPADKVREIIARHRDGASHRGGMILDDLKALLRPTLADMTDEERRACRWMQADVKGAVVRAVILNPDWEDGRARVMWSGGLFEWIDWSDVTPRPDLPRMEWPGDKKAETALTCLDQKAEDATPDALAVGDVIESADDPRLAALPTRSILLDCDGETVAKRGKVWVGLGCIPYPEEGTEFGPWTVCRIGGEDDQ